MSFKGSRFQGDQKPLPNFKSEAKPQEGCEDFNDSEAYSSFSNAISKNQIPTFKMTEQKLNLQGSSSYGMKQYGVPVPQANSTSILDRIKQANQIRKLHS